MAIKNTETKKVLSAHEMGLIEAALRHWALSETHHGRAPSELASRQANKLAEEILYSEIVCLSEIID